MKTRICLSLVGAILLISSLAFSQQTKKAESLYQEALIQMEGRGNFSKALEMFGQIIKDFPGNRQISARSQYQIGVCYEKLGKSEAQKAYERVIKEFADQQEVVKEARARLSALITAAPKPSLTVRQVWAGAGVNGSGEPSPDGKYLSIMDSESGDLAIREIETGQTRRLTNKGGWSTGEQVLVSRWSSDGKKIAYAWLNRDLFVELRIIGFDGSEPRILLQNRDVQAVPLDWSPDGKNILALISRKNISFEIALLSVADGALNTLKTTASPVFSWNLTYSPDGKYIAYDLPQQEGSQERDIFMLSIDGKQEISLVKHPARDWLLGWVPGSDIVLFASDRTGTQDAWALHVADGKPQGDPILVRKDIGQISPMGFTKKGSYYYSLEMSMVDAYEASLDLAKGTVVESPKKISQRFVGYNYSPEWSPDGKYLAYVSERRAGSSPQSSYILCLRSEKTGEEREVPLPIQSFWQFHWPADSGAIFATMMDKTERQGLFKIDIQTGKLALIAQRGSESLIKNFAVSPDGKSVYYAHFQWAKKLVMIIRHDLETGRQEEVYRKAAPPDIGGLTFSPDGKYLSFSTSDIWPHGNQGHVIRIMPSAGGEPRDLLQGKLENFTPHAWTRDGKVILFVKGKELWQMPAEGGEPQKINIELRDVRLHPDGRRIAFTSGKISKEIWVMENFLPKESETSAGLTLRKLEYAQLNTPFARLSPDGKKMASVVYIGGSPKRIDMLDLNSGAVKVLVDSGAGGQSCFVWSPQSDKIAYTFRGKELHVCDIDGTNSRVLLKNPGYQIYLSDWSRNGKKILCFFEGDDFTVRIGTVTTDGQIQFLASGNTIEFRSEPKFSPDAGYVACSLGEHAGNTDIYVWTADGSRKVRVTDHPGRDENPVWSPDGKYLVFLSDRNRSVDLWGVQMQDGETVGAPFVIKPDLGWRTRIQDFTSSGKVSLFMLGGAEPSNLFTVPVDQGSGSLSGPIAPISVYPTDHFFPRYSPNGKMIAYLSRKGQIGWPKLFVLDEKGSERELPLQGHYAVNVAWHPGNRSLLFVGWDKTFKAGIYELSLEKDEIRSVYSGERVDLKTFKGGLLNINLLPDAKKMMFFRYLEKGDVEVLTCEPDGQHLAVVLSQVNMPVWGSPSPTGENICYRIGDSLMLVSVSNGASKLIGSSTLDLEATWASHGESLMFREGSGLRIFSLKENTSRTVYQAPAGKTIGGMEMYGTAWSPNGNRVIFTERDTSASSTSPQKLFLISPGDGSLKTVGEAPEGYRLREIRWSPDGSKIVATGKSTRSARAPIYEYWVMENVLPKEVRDTK